MRIAALALCLTGALLAATPSRGTYLGDLSPEVRRASHCMLDVLKTTPGVTEARLRVTGDGGWLHPYLEYRAPEEDGWQEPTHFEMQKSSRKDRSIFFIAMVPGISGTPDGPDQHVTNRVIRSWKDRCAVPAVAISV